MPSAAGWPALLTSRSSSPRLAELLLTLTTTRLPLMPLVPSTTPRASNLRFAERDVDALQLDVALGAVDHARRRPC